MLTWSLHDCFVTDLFLARDLVTLDTPALMIIAASQPTSSFTLFILISVEK